MSTGIASMSRRVTPTTSGHSQDTHAMAATNRTSSTVPARTTRGAGTAAVPSSITPSSSSSSSSTSYASRSALPSSPSRSSSSLRASERIVASSSSRTRIVRDIFTSLQSMSRQQLEADHTGNHHSHQEDERGRIVISTIDDPSMEEDELQQGQVGDDIHDFEEIDIGDKSLEIDSGDTNDNILLAVDVEENGSEKDISHASGMSQEKRRSIMTTTTTIGSGPTPLVVATSLGETQFNSVFHHGSSSTNVSLSSTPSLPSSQSSGASRRSQPYSLHTPGDTERPRWTEAGRRAVEELREISKEDQEELGAGDQKEVQDKREEEEDEEAEEKMESVMRKQGQTKTTQEHKGKTRRRPPTGDNGHGEDNEDDGDGNMDDMQEDILWLIRGRKRTKHPRTLRQSYRMSQLGERRRGSSTPISKAMTTSSSAAAAAPASSSSTTATASTGLASQATGSLWLQDIERTQLEDHRRQPRRTRALVDATIMQMERKYYDHAAEEYYDASAKTVLKEMLSWLKDSPLTLPHELEGRAWMYESPIVLKPERIQ
ncbi:hypothetical protein BGW41_000410 [Actinomortierella wolfii]|nr:hypothetical protein BGW41_000410 [Actinomortierella wolfii]